MVPEEGFEPSQAQGPGDFESPASPSSATPALCAIIIGSPSHRVNQKVLTQMDKITIITKFSGAVAQLGERLNGIQEVRGSTPLSSTR